MLTRDHVIGCFIGGAIGDALGAPVEFMTLPEIRQRFGARGVTGFAPAYGRLGAITDDTQMTLFTAEGLIRARARLQDRGIADIPWIVHRAYIRWLVTQGGPDIIDSDTGSAISGWLVTNDALKARRAPGTTCLSALTSGRRGRAAEPLNDSKGCGAVMRIAPVGLAVPDRFGLGLELAALTHGHPSGYLAAGAFASIVGDVARGVALLAAIENALNTLGKSDGHDETVTAMDSAVTLAGQGSPTPESVEALGQGWVAEEALAITLYCALVASDARTALLLSVNHSGDSDSTGSMTGNLIGAMRGPQVLPDDLVDQLECRDLITQVANDFADVFVDGRNPPTDRYPPY